MDEFFNVALVRDVSIATAGAIAGGAVVYLFDRALKKLREARGGYTGVWEGTILGEDNKSVSKRDVILLRQDGEEARGSIARVFPQGQNHRRWEFRGRFRGSDFFAVFWSTDPSIQSYGCWYVQQKTDDLFSGFYLRLSERDRNLITPVALEVQRTRKRLSDGSQPTR